MSTELTRYDAVYAQAAEASSKQLRGESAGTFLSIKGGVLRAGEDEMPGNQLACIIVDSAIENKFFDTRYVEGVSLPPKCYATSLEPDGMFPHVDMQKDLTYFQPQHVEAGRVMGCEGCPMNEWGSADTGRGKACSNRYKLAMLPAGMYEKNKQNGQWELSLFDDPEHYAKADQAMLSLPVTSGKAWGEYVRTLMSGHRRPPFGAVTRIYITSDPKTQFKVNFELIELLDDSLAGAVIERHKLARQTILQGYDPPTEEQKAPPQRRQFGGRR